VILVATGTHRGNSDAELHETFGDAVVDNIRVVNHDARDAGQLAFAGTYGNGVPTWLNRAWLEADVRITTGFVEPHFFAGFSGGPKLVAPGGRRLAAFPREPGRLRRKRGGPPVRSVSLVTGAGL
jgi:nickel-dependent lactate racemase